jgi:hypothetical protein
VEPSEAKVYTITGLQDTNLARVRATQEYLSKCHYVFVVAKISRAITDQSLKSSLYDVLSKHIPEEWESSAGRYMNVAVICTRTEVKAFRNLDEISNAT